MESNDVITICPSCQSKLVMSKDEICDGCRYLLLSDLVKHIDEFIAIIDGVLEDLNAA